MKICGIIVEYNPLTNGHLYHIQKAREISQCDLLIAVMSGNFVQRGEPAIVDKWQRAKAACLNGVDLVVELPFVFACQGADYFAKGAIAILNALHCDTIVFGSESLQKEEYLKLYNESQTIEYQSRVQKYVDSGYSYPQACNMAFENQNISLPNDLLGFSYVKQIYSQNTHIDFFPIKRETGYHDTNIESMSASSLRKAIKNNQDISNYSPMKLEGFLHDKNDLFEPLYYKLNFANLGELKNIPIVKEGIEHRLIEHIKKVSSIEELLDSVGTKRYTKPRILRTITHILINQTIQPDLPGYVRLLACSKVGKQHLRYFSDYCDLPFISQFSQIKHPHLDMELQSTKLYALALPPNQRQAFIKKEYASIPFFE